MRSPVNAAVLCSCGSLVLRYGMLLQRAHYGVCPKHISYKDAMV